MAKYTGPKCRLARKFRVEIDGLKSKIKSLGSKCKLEVPPGQHGAKRGRVSNHGIMLNEKQKLRIMYGCLLEKQFYIHYMEADRMKGPTGENLLKILERRLDNVVYRMGFGSTRAEARQIVNHSSVLVNGHRVNIASYQVSPDDVIEIREKAKQQLRIKASIEVAEQMGFPEWLDVNVKKLVGVFKRVPDRDEVPGDINENLIVEFYSK